ncbi:MAG: four helix bundle protein [Gemmatimonadales bacterium]
MRDHTSLAAWQEARAVTLECIAAGTDHWRPFAAAVFHQLQRASLSVQLNIAEGYTFGHSATYRRHLRIAYGSAVETGELLRLLVDAEILPSAALEQIEARNHRCQGLILGLLRKPTTSTPPFTEEAIQASPHQGPPTPRSPRPRSRHPR